MLDIDVMSAKQVSYFDSGETFSQREHNFFVAAALTEYNSDPEPTEDEKYGKIIFEHFGWGNTEASGIGAGRQTIETRSCTEEELGMTSDDETIGAYKIMDRSKKELETYKRKFKCTDRDNLIVWGDYSSEKA